MAVVTTFYAKTVTWNSLTWDKSTQGLLEVRYEHEGEPLKGRTGDDEYATFLAIVDKNCRVTVRLREVKVTYSPGAFSGALVATIREKTNLANPAITFAGMVLVAVRGAQGRAQTGDVELVFEHLSSDGTTNPVS